MNSTRRGALAFSALLAAASLAGCGIVDDLRYGYAKEDADKIFLDSVRATTALDSVRVSGSLDPRNGPPVRFSLMSAAEKRCAGEMEFSTADFDVVATPEGDFLKGSAASWQQYPGLPRGQGAVAARVLDDRWVRLPEDEPLDLDSLCRIAAEFLTEEERTAVDAGAVPANLDVTSKGLSEAAGEKAVKLVVVDDKGASDVWVSLEEPHYILKFSRRERQGRMSLVFSDFNFPAEVKVPAAKDIYDLAKGRARSG